MDKLPAFWSGFLDGWNIAWPAFALFLAIVMFAIGQWLLAGIAMVLFAGDIFITYQLEKLKKDRNNG